MPIIKTIRNLANRFIGKSNAPKTILNTQIQVSGNLQREYLRSLDVQSLGTIQPMIEPSMPIFQMDFIHQNNTESIIKAFHTGSTAHAVMQYRTQFNVDVTAQSLPYYMRKLRIYTVQRRHKYVFVLYEDNIWYLYLYKNKQSIFGKENTIHDINQYPNIKEINQLVVNMLYV